MKVTVLPLGGIGNRMRVLRSAVLFCTKHNYSLKVLWINNDDLACDLRDLFDQIGIDYKEPASRLEYWFFKTFFRYKALRFGSFIYASLGRLFYDAVVLDSHILANKGSLDLGSLNQSNANILIATCYTFTEFSDYNNFVLSKSIDTLLKDRLTLQSSSYYGVHIRGTDNLKAIKNSPISGYIATIEKILSENPNAQFFLATDEQSIKDEFRARFGEHLYTFDSTLKRDSKDGIIDALIELYCLANCHTIICSRFSSFADTAQLIGKRKLVINV